MSGEFQRHFSTFLTRFLWQWSQLKVNYLQIQDEPNFETVYRREIKFKVAKRCYFFDEIPKKMGFLKTVPVVSLKMKPN